MYYMHSHLCVRLRPAFGSSCLCTPNNRVSLKHIHYVAVCAPVLPAISLLSVKETQESTPEYSEFLYLYGNQWCNYYTPYMPTVLFVMVLLCHSSECACFVCCTYSGVKKKRTPTLQVRGGGRAAAGGRGQRAVAPQAAAAGVVGSVVRGEGGVAPSATGALHSGAPPTPLCFI